MKTGWHPGAIYCLMLIAMLAVVFGSSLPSPAHAQESDDPSVLFIQDIAAQFGVPPSQIRYRQGAMSHADYYHQITFFSESQQDDYTINIARGKDANGSDSGVYWAERTYAGEESTGIHAMSATKFHAVTRYLAAFEDAGLVSQHIFWGSGQWGFEIYHRVTPGQAVLPPIETIAEKVYAAGVKHGLIAETAAPDVPAPTPDHAAGRFTCTIKGHPGAPLLFSLEAYNPDGSRPPTIQLHWKGELTPLLAIYDKETNNWVAWDTPARTQTISANQPGIFAVRALLRLDRRIPTPEQPVTGSLSATATNPGGGKPVSLGSCDFSIDHLGFIYKASTAVKGERSGKIRYMRPGDTVFMGERLVLEADPAFANPSPGVPVQEKNRLAAFTIVFLDGTAMESGFDQTASKEATVLVSNQQGKIAVWLATKLIGETGGKVVETGMKFVVKRLVGVVSLPASIVIEVMSEFAGNEIESLVCDDSGEKCNVVVVNQAGMRPPRLGVDIKPKVEVTPWSFFEIAVLKSGWRIRTFEGSPEVLTADGQRVSLAANQEMQIDEAGSGAATTDFDPQLSDAWWAPELMTATELVDSDMAVTVNAAGATGASAAPSSVNSDLPGWLAALPPNTTWLALLGLGSCGVVVVVLVAGFVVMRSLSGVRRKVPLAQPVYPHAQPAPQTYTHPSAQYSPPAGYPPPQKARHTWVIWVVLLLALPCVCLVAVRLVRFLPLEALINAISNGI